MSGVLAMDARTQHPKVLVHVGGNPENIRGIVQSGTWLGTDPLPPALGYSWGEGDQLVPDTPLNAGTAPPLPSVGPVGVPGGGSRSLSGSLATMGFSSSRYQEGVWAPAPTSRVGVQLVLQTSSHQQIETPGVYTWQTAFAAWSPDGRYLVGPLLVDERLQPQGRPAPSAQTLADFGLAQWPLLPVRDAALDQILLSAAYDGSQ